MSNTTNEEYLHTITVLADEVARLAAALHARQVHPDYSYSMTFEDKEEHHTSREGWELNTAIGDNGRVEVTNYHQPAQLYWRRLNEKESSE